MGLVRCPNLGRSVLGYIEGGFFCDYRLSLQHLQRSTRLTWLCTVPHLEVALSLEYFSICRCFLGSDLMQNFTDTFMVIGCVSCTTSWNFAGDVGFFFKSKIITGS